MINIIAFDVVKHYDALIDENNDPARDPAPLSEYVNGWDGEAFISALELTKSKNALEIGVGTGRLALKTAPLCNTLTGIDISPKTIARAKENLAAHSNIELILGDFMTRAFDSKFDVVYSSLTFMHIKRKADAIAKAAALLKRGGILALSIDKNQVETIDFQTRKLNIYPDNPDDIEAYMRRARLTVTRRFDTERAHVLVALNAL